MDSIKKTESMTTENILQSNNMRFRYQLYVITGYRKNHFTLSEYSILSNSNDIDMYRHFQYLKYILYLNFLPTHPYHYRRMKDMCSNIEKKERARKELEKAKVKQKRM